VPYFLFSCPVHDHKISLAARALPFNKNRGHNGVDNQLDATVWAFDLAIIEAHMPNKFFLCDRHGDKYIPIFCRLSRL